MKSTTTGSVIEKDAPTITKTDSFATSTATQPGLITYQITTRP